MRIKKSARARGSSRGGCGGGCWERLDPDFDIHRLQKMKEELKSLPSKWQKEYLSGLGRYDRNVLERWLEGRE